MYSQNVASSSTSDREDAYANPNNPPPLASQSSYENPRVLRRADPSTVNTSECRDPELQADQIPLPPSSTSSATSSNTTHRRKHSDRGTSIRTHPHHGDKSTPPRSLRSSRSGLRGRRAGKGKSSSFTTEPSPEEILHPDVDLDDFQGERSDENDNYTGDTGFHTTQSHQISRMEMQGYFNRLDQSIGKGFDRLASAIDSLATSIPNLTNVQAQVSNSTAADHPTISPQLLPKSRKGPKIYSNPQRRAFSSTQLASSVRKHIQTLSGGDVLGPQAMVSRETAEAYATTWSASRGGSDRQCCSASDFCIDLYGSPHSPWN